MIAHHNYAFIQHIGVLEVNFFVNINTCLSEIYDCGLCSDVCNRDAWNFGIISDFIGFNDTYYYNRSVIINERFEGNISLPPSLAISAISKTGAEASEKHDQESEKKSNIPICLFMGPVGLLFGVPIFIYILYKNWIIPGCAGVALATVGAFCSSILITYLT